ncbi:MAG: alcohol dehydrogenase catalytic domain-containing protein [Acidimicrobiales bacterium]
MRGIKMTADGIRVVPPSGDPAEGSVHVTVVSSGICGSDLHLVSFGPSWAILGHEFCGVLDDGTAVAIVPVVHCGSCDRCLAGAEQQCRNALGAMYGISLDGGLADEVWVHPNCAIPLPDGLELAHANLVEPLAVALHGVNRASVVSGMRVLVLGAGPIGLATIAAARSLGASVDLEGHRPSRMAAGERLGASVNVGTDYDVVLDAAGTQSSLDRAVELVRPGGTVSILGTYWSPVQLGLGFQMKEMNLLPSFTYGHHHGVSEFAEAARILQAVPDLPDVMITHQFGLDDAAEAFRVAGDRDADPIKVVVHP